MLTIFAKFPLPKWLGNCHYRSSTRVFANNESQQKTGKFYQRMSECDFRQTKKRKKKSRVTFEFIPGVRTELLLVRLRRKNKKRKRKVKFILQIFSLVLSSVSWAYGLVKLIPKQTGWSNQLVGNRKNFPLGFLNVCWKGMPINGEYRNKKKKMEKGKENIYKKR